MKKLNTTTLAIACAVGSIASANAAISILDGFEGSLGNWSVSGGLTSLYTYGGSGTNWAPTGTGAVLIPSTNGEQALTLTNALDLSTATTATISYDWVNGSGASQPTRFFIAQYSADGGSNWTNLGSQHNGNITSNSQTITTGLTANSLFRVVDLSAGGTQNMYLDNMLITSDAVAVPEPTTTALLGLGGLALILRRRK